MMSIRQSTMSWLLLPTTILILAVMLTACGRRGALEPPPSATDAPRQQGLFGPGASGSTGAPEPEKPDQPFILDPLI